tara:strand:- start:561 stop:989 length:429 start_codon:yes stop_codon:yes gene_type:complete
MINSNELRIGNLVWISDNLTLSIYREAQEVNIYNLIQLDPFFAGHKAGHKESYIDIEPIPITEEWLVRFGFIKEDEEWKLFPCAEIQIIVFNENNYNGVMFYTRTIHTDYTPIYCGSQINNIHQLQNLYFALAGEELKLKSI